MGATFWYLAAWALGGVVLFTLLLVRGAKPLSLPFALLGFGGGGFGARALGYDELSVTLASAAAGGVLLATIGYVLSLPLRASRRGLDLP